MHTAAGHDHCDIMLLLTAFGSSIEKKNDEGRSPLNIAQRNGKFDAMRTLLALGADPSTLDPQRMDSELQTIIDAQSKAEQEKRQAIVHRAKTKFAKKFMVRLHFFLKKNINIR